MWRMQGAGVTVTLADYLDRLSALAADDLAIINEARANVARDRAERGREE